MSEGALLSEEALLSVSSPRPVASLPGEVGTTEGAAGRGPGAVVDERRAALSGDLSLGGSSEPHGAQLPGVGTLDEAILPPPGRPGL